MERDEFEKLYLALYPRLCVFAEKILKDTATSKNIVQDVFLKVYEKFDFIKIDSSWEAYLVKSVFNNCLLYKRKIFIHQKHSDKIRYEYLTDCLVEKEIDDEDIAKLELVDKAIDSLSDKCRRVFILNKKDGLSYARIAVVLGISVKTVDNHLSKAMKKVKEYVGKISIIIICI